MRLARLAAAAAPDALPLWPPLLASRGPGARSDGHAHHAMHLVLACGAGATLKVRGPAGPFHTCAGVLTAPDVPHALDARGAEVLLVFLDPESEAGAALRAAALAGQPLRLLSDAERAALVDVAPSQWMQAEGRAWMRRACEVLAGPSATLLPSPAPGAVHPRVRRLLAYLRTQPPGADTSLPALAAQVGLSPSRLMHAFTASIGIPLRPYLQWLKLQRAAAAITSGMPLSHAAVAAGFSDAAHMARTFRRTFGMTPSMLRPSAATTAAAARDGSQLVQDRAAART